MTPTLGSSRYRHRMPMTATPSTNGAKKIARIALRPRNFLLRATARARGSAMRSGTLSTVKIAVARIEFQNGPDVVESGVKSST